MLVVPTQAMRHTYQLLTCIVLALLCAVPRAAAQPTPHATGLGIAAPPIEAGRTLYFYSTPDARQPDDSLTFVHAGPEDRWTTARDLQQKKSTWLRPEVIKLDYDLLFFHVVAMRRVPRQGLRLEVVVQEDTGQTRWIDAEAATFLSWPEYLMDVFSVEPLDPSAHSIRTRPAEEAPALSLDAGEHGLQVVAVQGDWLLVQPSTLNSPPDATLPTGWLRWQHEGRLLITYYLLA